MKFLNCDYLDRGATQRRHVRAIGIRFIGKEANQWEEHFFPGSFRGCTDRLWAGPQSAEPFREELRLADSVHRMRRISEVSGIARNSLSLSHGDRLRLRRSWWLIRAMAPLDQVASGQPEFERRFVTGFWQKSTNAGCEGSQDL